MNKHTFPFHLIIFDKNIVICYFIKSSRSLFSTLVLLKDYKIYVCLKFSILCGFDCEIPEYKLVTESDFKFPMYLFIVSLERTEELTTYINIFFPFCSFYHKYKNRASIVHFYIIECFLL